MLCSQVKLEMWSPTETQIVWSSSDCWMVQRHTCVITKYREAWSDVCYAGTTIHGPGNDILLYTRLRVRRRRCTLRVPTLLGMLHLSPTNVVWSEFAPSTSKCQPSLGLWPHTPTLFIENISNYKLVYHSIYVELAFASYLKLVNSFSYYDERSEKCTNSHVSSRTWVSSGY